MKLQVQFLSFVLIGFTNPMTETTPTQRLTSGEITKIIGSHQITFNFGRRGWPRKGEKMLKKVISWAIGVPAGIITVSEVEDLRFWWIPFIAMGVAVALLAWNGAFKKEEVYGK